MRKVLIVEDDRKLNDTFGQLVQRIKDTEVVQAFDKATAEQELRRSNFAVMVVDVKLGEDPREKLSGFQLLTMLSGKPTVVIVVSGMPNDMLPELAISLQAFDFLSKPINELDFIHKVEQALASYEQLVRDSPPATGATWPPGLDADPKRKLGLRWKGRSVPLTLTELRLIHCLIEPPNTVVGYSTLAQQLKTPTSGQKAVTTHMTGARAKFVDIDPGFQALDSEPGRGYVWRTN